MQNQSEIGDDDEEGSALPQPDLIKSYLAFGLRALRAHRWLAIAISVSLAALTVGLVSIWPRTYSCTTVLATQEIRALDAGREDVLTGVAEVILSRDNLLQIAKQTDLTTKWEQGLPPILKLKHQLMARIRGSMSEQDRRDALVGLLQSRMSVTSPGWGEKKFTITVEWQDGATAAKLAQAAQQSFLDRRKAVEVSSISRSISIRENYARELSNQITTLQTQLQAIRDGKLDKLQDSVPKPEKEATPPPPVVHRPSAPSRAEPDPEIEELKTTLATKQRSVKDQEDQRDRRLAELQSNLIELRAKYTPAHPSVRSAEVNIASQAQDSPQLSALRAEVKSLQARLQAKVAAQPSAPARGFSTGSGGSDPAAGAAGTVDPLSADVLRLMQDGSEEIDPALGAEFNASLSNYAKLRDEINRAVTDLKIAQEAFERRYYVVIPAVAPSAPSKPSVPKVIGIGLIASLLLGLVAALLAEFRKGKVVEKWQVYQLGLPVLADLRWPPGADR